jgi:signal transduction histidine kinase
MRQMPYYLEGHPDVLSELAVPVSVGGQVIAVLNLESSQVAAFDREDLDFYSAIAGQLGVALQNAQLYQEVHRHAEDLAEAVARLQELDRLKSEFIQNVSHELRMPLALILGYAELLTNGDLGELGQQQRRPAEIIARRARMLGELVEDIILILLTDARTHEREAVALDELASTAVEDFGVAARQAGLVIEIETSPELPRVSGGITNLRRVLDNLISNAIKFTPEGGRVVVRLQQKDSQVLLQISDTGIGIALEEQERIFERFYQIDGSLRRRYGGAGLGLALVKEIVEAYDGQVSVESEPGVGSTFTVRLLAAE